MLGFLDSINQMRSQAKSYKHQGKLLTIQANATRKQANAQAALIELQGQQEHEIANRNIRTARENQRKDIGTARTIQATSGFTSEGSGNSRARQVQDALDAEIANMSLSASIASHNSWQSARDTIKQGNVAAMQYEAQAQQMFMAEDAMRDQMLWTGISAAAGAIGGAVMGGMSGYTAGSEAVNAHTDSFLAGGMTTEQFQQNMPSMFDYTMSGALNGAYNGLNIGAGAANAFNPFTATMTPAANNRKNNWGANLSVLLGRTPYTTPQAGNLFSMF